MNEIQSIFKEGNLDPMKYHTVLTDTGKVANLNAFSSREGTLVAAFEDALIQGIVHPDQLIPRLEAMPIVYLKRKNAPRKSSLNTQSLVSSLNNHIKWLCGHPVKGRTWNISFEERFGPQFNETALKVQKEVQNWAMTVWKPESKAYLRALDAAIVAGENKPEMQEVKELPPPPAEITVPAEVIASAPATCQATKKDGSPCKGKPLANGYCSFHQKLAQPIAEA